MLKFILSASILVALNVILFSLSYSSNNIEKYGEVLEPNKLYPAPIPSEIKNRKVLTYEQELELFSEQISRAFSIPLGKARKYAPVIIEAEVNTGLSEIKIASLIMTESTFNEFAESSVGAYGSTQIRPMYWSEFCDGKGYDIYSFKGNILCGSEIVTFLMDKYCPNDIQCALEHYNVGRGNLLTNVKYQQAGKRYSKKVEYYSKRLSKNFLLTVSN